MNSSQQIKLGAIMSYVAIGINIVSGLVYTPWMIRSIGRENFGLYTLALSVITLFVFDFGLSAAVTRFIAKYLAEGRQDKANNCLGLVYRLYLAIDLVLLAVLAILYFFIPQIYKELTPEEIDKFKIIYVMVSVYSVLSFPFIPVNGVLTAHEKFVQLKMCDVAHKLMIVGAMTVCLLLGYGLYALVIVNVTSGLLTIVLKLWVIYFRTPQRINYGYYNRTEFGQVVSYSGWVTVMQVAQRFIFNIAPSILGYFSGSASIAILGIAMTIEGYTYTFSSAINGMFLPRVTRIVTHDSNELLPLMVRVGRVQILIIGAIILGFICLGQDFIQLWVGEKFSASYLCAVLIVLPSLLKLPQEIGVQTIYAMDRVRHLAIVYVGMAILNIILAISLAPSLGALGISISVCIAYLFRTMGLDFIFWRELHIDVLTFFRKAFVPLLPPLVLVLIIDIMVVYYNPLALSWFSFVLESLVFIVIYSCIMWIGGMNQYEKDLVYAPLRKGWKKMCSR